MVFEGLVAWGMQWGFENPVSPSEDETPSMSELVENERATVRLRLEEVLCSIWGESSNALGFSPFWTGRGGVTVLAIGWEGGTGMLSTDKEVLWRSRPVEGLRLSHSVVTTGTRGNWDWLRGRGDARQEAGEGEGEIGLRYRLFEEFTFGLSTPVRVWQMLGGVSGLCWRCMCCAARGDWGIERRGGERGVG